MHPVVIAVYLRLTAIAVPHFPISYEPLVWKKAGFTDTLRVKKWLAQDAFDHAWKVAMDARFEIRNTVDRLKQIVRNFRDGAPDWH
jgi:hypothetical protein